MLGEEMIDEASAKIALVIAAKGRAAGLQRTSKFEYRSRRHPAGPPGTAPRLQGVDTTELILENVRIPAGRVLGGRTGRGFYQMMDGVEVGRVNVAAPHAASAQQQVDQRPASLLGCHDTAGGEILPAAVQLCLAATAAARAVRIASTGPG